MFRTPTTKQNVLHRLKIMRGHLDKVAKMIEADTYCIDVLIQTKAITQALSKVDQILLEQYLSHCVVDHIKNGREDQAIKEVMKVFTKK